MDRLEKNTGINEDGFVKTVFPFDEDQKGLLLNIIQYSVLAIIPVVLLLKVIKNYVPEADDDKGSLVILVEVIGQVDAIELYPNPTNGIFNLTGISNLDVDVKIFSVTGKLVLNEKPMNDKVDVSSLSKGIYFVEIKWNNQSILKKLIKK